jgi:hypothetical protein
MSKVPTLHELNQHLFAAMLPDTHGFDKADAPKPAKAGKKAAAKAEYTAEQLEILTAAGITDPAAADPQTVAAILGL